MWSERQRGEGRKRRDEVEADFRRAVHMFYFCSLKNGKQNIGSCYCDKADEGMTYQTGTKKEEEKRTAGVLQRNARLKEKETEEVKWSKAIKEIEGMKVRDGENKIMERGREIEKGTLGSWSKSV